jgi:hypothetical protein
MTPRDAPARPAPRHRAARPRHIPDLLVRVGGVLFAIGVVSIAAEFVPFLFGHGNRPLWIGLLTELLSPIGLGLALVGLVLNARPPGGRRPPPPPWERPAG